MTEPDDKDGPATGPEPAPSTSGESGRQAAPGGDLASLRAAVARSLAAALGQDDVVADEDGDWPVKAGSAMVIVRIVEGLPPALQLYSPVLREVATTASLLEALNEINGRIRYGRAFVANHVVVVAMELPAIGLTADHLAFACGELGNLADHLDDTLRSRFGGRVTFDPNPKLAN